MAEGRLEVAEERLGRYLPHHRQNQPLWASLAVSPGVFQPLGGQTWPDATAAIPAANEVFVKTGPLAYHRVFEGFICITV